MAAANAMNEEDIDMKQKSNWLIEIPPGKGVFAADGQQTVIEWSQEGAVVVITADGTDECTAVTTRLRQISAETVEKDISSGSGMKKAQLSAVQSYMTQLTEERGKAALPCVLIHGHLLDLPSPEEGGIQAVDLGPLVFPVNTSKGLCSPKRQVPVSILVNFQGKTYPMTVDPALRGAIFKSQAMSLVGSQKEASTSNFGSYVMDLDGHPFAGREPVSTHPAWREGCEVVLRKRAEGEGKRAGTT